jgi:peptidoglycan hydrolase CwlO-like protein
MMEGLEDLKKELEAKRLALAEELDSAVGKVASIEKDMKRVDDAIRALTKGKTRSRKKTPSTPGTGTPQSPHSPHSTGQSFHGSVTGGGHDLTSGTFDPFAQ